MVKKVVKLGQFLLTIAESKKNVSCLWLIFFISFSSSFEVGTSNEFFLHNLANLFSHQLANQRPSSASTYFEQCAQLLLKG